MAVVRLTYKLTSGQANLIDLARGLSLTERRLIHQKQVFTVLGGLVVDNRSPDLVAGTKIKISTAPNNFYTRNAVTRGFRAWKAMRAKMLEIDSSMDTPKYSDFKVLLDQTTSAQYLNPFSAGSVELNDGEWTYAQLTPEDGSAAKNLQIVGPHTASRYSLAKGWLETRDVPQSSQPQRADLNGDGVEDINVDFISTLFEDGSEYTDNINKIVDDNDFHPFQLGELMTTQSAWDAAEPNNLQLQFIHHSNVNETAHAVPGFQALCGLLRVDVAGGSNPILMIDVETKGWNF
jgi:hypothetical protein